jgi:stage IV sporulation protein FB
MSWSITLFRFGGTDVRVHLTFLLLLAWFGIAGYTAAGWPGALGSILFILALFACVVLHEFGHALVARRYGIATPDITLLPIGGLARLSRIPEQPGAEVLIAIAGPLVNLVIVGVLLLFGADLTLGADDITGYGHSFISQLALVNLYLFGFNLIPAFPMDGGRILRALLAFRFSRRRATEIAARVGQAVAFLFVLLGLVYTDVLLILIAVFVFLAATSEAGHTVLMDIAVRVPIDRAMIRSFESLSPQATIGDAADAILRTTQHEFPVVDGAGKPRGVVTRGAIVAALKSAGAGSPALEVMIEMPNVVEGAGLGQVVRAIYEDGAPVVGVIDGEGKLVGYVSPENLSELMMLEPGVEARAPGPWGSAHSS